VCYSEEFRCFHATSKATFRGQQMDTMRCKSSGIMYEAWSQHQREPYVHLILMKAFVTPSSSSARVEFASLEARLEVKRCVTADANA